MVVLYHPISIVDVLQSCAVSCVVTCNAICGNWWIRGFHRSWICTLGLDSLIMLWFSAMYSACWNFLLCQYSFLWMILDRCHSILWHSVLAWIDKSELYTPCPWIAVLYSLIQTSSGLLISPHKNLHIRSVCRRCNSSNPRSRLLLSTIGWSVMFWLTWRLSSDIFQRIFVGIAK